MPGLPAIPKNHDTPSIFGKSLAFRRCNANRSFPKILGFLGIPKIHDTPSIFGNYLVFHRCNVNSLFPKIPGFLGIPKIHDTPYFWEITHFSALHRQSFIPKNTWIFGNELVFLGNKEKKRLNNKTNNIYFYIVFCLYLWAFSFPKINESFC